MFIQEPECGHNTASVVVYSSTVATYQEESKEKFMAQKLRYVQMPVAAEFPPEAYDDFSDVSDKDIADWRAKLSERFGIGKGRLVAIEEPQALVRG
jgi:hypothetical protein